MVSGFPGKTFSRLFQTIQVGIYSKKYYCSLPYVWVHAFFFFRYTPLMEAAREGYLPMVALLVENGTF